MTIIYQYQFLVIFDLTFRDFSRRTLEMTLKKAKKHESMMDA